MAGLAHFPIRLPLPNALLAGAVLSVCLFGCGKDDNPAGAGDLRSAVVRWELTSAPRGGTTIAEIPATFHSFEDAGDCTLVLYDIDDGAYGDSSYVQFQIPGPVCIAAFDSEIFGYWFGGQVNPALGSIDDLIVGEQPFATGFWGRYDDPTASGTFEFYVDELSGEAP